MTERTAHVKLLAGKLRERIPEVITLTGRMGAKEAGELFKRISETPTDCQLTLVVTGKYIGEGFDEPRLDTLLNHKQRSILQKTISYACWNTHAKMMVMFD